MRFFHELIRMADRISSSTASTVVPVKSATKVAAGKELAAKAAKARENAKERQRLLIGRQLYPITNGKVIPATDENIGILKTIQKEEKDRETKFEKDLAELALNAEIPEFKKLTLKEQIDELKKRKNTRKVKASKKFVPKHGKEALNALRKNIGKTNIGKLVGRSTRRLNRLASLRNDGVTNNATIKKELEIIVIPKNRRTLKKKELKNELKTFMSEAEVELKALAKEGKNPNQATIKHLALLRHAGYTISAAEIKELVSKIKKNQDITNEKVIKSLIAQSVGKRICDRCLISSIFGVEPDEDSTSNLSSVNEEREENAF